jgi:large subunit ribosomal protein L3
MKTLIGKKIGMTQVYAEDGTKTAVTVVDVSEVVVSKHLQAKPGEAVTHVEIGKGARKKPIKADAGNYKATGKVPYFKRAIKLNGDEITEIGTVLGANIFEVGEKVDVIGTTKGKGFQGAMKRHGFHGGPRTHGGPTGKMRAPGSIAPGTTPGRIYKGKKMPGHMGDVKKTVQNLKVVKVDQENNLIAIAGAIPGANGTYVLITKAVRYK